MTESQQRYELTEARSRSPATVTTTMSQDELEDFHAADARLHKSTLRKLDCLLLPFLALLFLFNALDKSNVGKPPSKAPYHTLERKNMLM